MRTDQIDRARRIDRARPIDRARRIDRARLIDRPRPIDRARLLDRAPLIDRADLIDLRAAGTSGHRPSQGFERLGQNPPQAGGLFGRSPSKRGQPGDLLELQGLRIFHLRRRKAVRGDLP